MRPVQLEEAERAGIAQRVRKMPRTAAVKRCAALCPVARTDAEEFELYQLTAVCTEAAQHRRAFLLWRGVLLSEETDELLMLSQQLGLPRPEITRVELWA